MDYSSIGLNQFLQPINSPVATNQGAVDGYTFDSNNERGLITGAKLGNFSFNAGTGGTISLGGTLNGNGFLEVKDSSGAVIVTVNNNGIAVTGGSVTIANTSGSTILDGSGIVSGNNFAFGNIADNTSEDITSTSFVDLTNMVLTMVLQREARVLFLGSLTAVNTSLSTGQAAIGRMTLNGNLIGAQMVLAGYDYGIGQVLSSTEVHALGTVSAGTHTIKMQMRSSGGGHAQTGSNPRNMSYIVLGT